MKVKHFVFILSLYFYFTSNFAFSQKWDSLPGRFQNPSAVRVMYTDTNFIYAAGEFNEIGGKHFQGIARWNGVHWDSLGTGIDGKGYATGNSYPANTLAIVDYANKLFVGGAFNSLGNVNAYRIGTWDGTKWDSLQIQPFTVNYYSGTVNAMAVISNNLYVVGTFDTIAGFLCNGVACWNDTNWSSLNFPKLKNMSEIDAICQYNGSIYVGGIFYDSIPGDTISNILRWNGKNWLSVGGGIKGGLVDVWSMVVYNGELYVAGEFSKSDGNVGDNIQKWNGTLWSDVGGGTNWITEYLLVYTGKLYAFGAFQNAGSIPANEIAEWDGTNWCGLGSTFDNTIGTACIYKDTLYIGGGFWTINKDSIRYIAKWVGGNYVDTCGVLGVNELKVESEKIKVWPNPSFNGVFTVEVKSEKCGGLQYAWRKNI